MKTDMPLSKSIRHFVRQTENILDTEISLLRNPEADPNGMLVDIYTYDIEKNIIIFPAHYIGLLKDFIIAKLCVNLLIKGAAAKKSRYLVCSFTGDSVYRGIHQIYLDALKDEAKKERKLPVHNLIRMLNILFTNINDDINDLPWNPITNARVYHRMPQIRKTQLYYLMKLPGFAEEKGRHEIIRLAGLALSSDLSGTHPRGEVQATMDQLQHPDRRERFFRVLEWIVETVRSGEPVAPPFAPGSKADAAG